MGYNANMKRRIAVRGIIKKNDQLLLAKLKDYHTGQPKDFWCTVGGSLEDGEGLVDGVRREIIEETGVIPVVGKLLYIQQYQHAELGTDNLEFFFEIKNVEDFEHIDLSKTSHGKKEIAEIGFFNPEELNVLPDFLKRLNLETERTRTYSNIL